MKQESLDEQLPTLPSSNAFQSSPNRLPPLQTSDPIPSLLSLDTSQLLSSIKQSPDAETKKFALFRQVSSFLI